MHIAITGASGGLGAALAEAYAAPGMRLSLSARRLPELETVAERCRGKGAEVFVAQVDVTDVWTVTAWLRGADAERPLDLVISNAGVMASHGADGALESIDDATRQLRVNLEGAVLVLREAAEIMRLRGRGRLCAISSLAGLQPLADEPAYCASKAGLNAYCEALTEFLAPHGVAVTLICPGYIATPMGDGYDGWRPLELSAGQAADRIKRAIDGRRGFYAFPAPLYWLIRFGRIWPASWRRLVTRAFRFRLEP